MSRKEARCPEEAAGRKIRRSMAMVILVMRASCVGLAAERREVRQGAEQRVRCLGGWVMEWVSVKIWRQVRGREERSSSVPMRNLGVSAGDAMSDLMRERGVSSGGDSVVDGAWV